MAASFGKGAFGLGSSLIAKHTIKRIELLFLRQISESGLDLEAIPYYPTVNALWPRHPSVGNHLIELGDTYADVTSCFFAAHAARRVGKWIGAQRHGCFRQERANWLG
jgi:hypothetical protein